ncbi:hypothetical protein ACFCYB_31950 [Streptomyces sp. NPDC056309]|uniref:hypothetical protein n=1 Tax=unclassified Streptomyces TaxID=2593676 RepID=UPI0035E39DB5
MASITIVGTLVICSGWRVAAVERTLVAAAEDAEGQPFGVRVERLLIVAGSGLGRRGSARDGAGRCCISTWSSVWTRWPTGSSMSCSGTGTGGDGAA